MQPEDFKDLYNVSRETFEKLEAYHKLLFKWQKAINLVGPKTLQDSWARHFSDSAQLHEYIPNNVSVIADLGSGAGFPGLVLAMMCPDKQVHLIESDERKAQFLRTVSRETYLQNLTVHNERIENIEGLCPDLVTARALASLDDLFAFCLPWAQQNPQLNMLFLKGRQAEEEIAAAQARYDFTCESHPSKTDSESQILFISALKAR